VGRFLGSRLYVDYTPGGAFNTGGSLTGSSSDAVVSFTTTAPAGPSPADGRWAFEDSEIAAPGLGAARLSGVKTANGGTAFGVKTHVLPGTSIMVKSADDPAVPLNVPLAAGAAAVAGDFYVLQV
jgi:hypothetical protein